MTKILKFQRKPKEQTDPHQMNCVKEDDWIVWRCHECSRKVKSAIRADEMIIERQGNFYARHIYQVYQPSEDEWENAGIPPMKLNFDFDFPQTNRGQ
jgi:hypothetical protein